MTKWESPNVILKQMPPVLFGQWRSKIKLIGGARAPFFLFSPSPRYGIYIYFWSLPNYWGGP